MSSKRIHRVLNTPLWLLAVVLAFAVSAASADSKYDFGYVWDVWEIWSTEENPTPANTSFKIQVRNRFGTWRTVDSGVTDEDGYAWGMVCTSFGPTTEGDGDIDLHDQAAFQRLASPGE